MERVDARMQPEGLGRPPFFQAENGGCCRQRAALSCAPACRPPAARRRGVHARRARASGDKPLATVTRQREGPAQWPKTLNLLAPSLSPGHASQRRSASGSRSSDSDAVACGFRRRAGGASAVFRAWHNGGLLSRSRMLVSRPLDEPEAPAVAVPPPEVLASLRRELEEKTRALQAAVSCGGIRLAASVVEHASAAQPPPEQLQRLLGLRSGEVRPPRWGAVRARRRAAPRRATPTATLSASGCPRPC